MNRTRVVHVVVAGEMGGAERMVLDLARSARATGAEHAIALITPSRAVRDAFANTDLRVHCRGVGTEGPATYLWQSLGPRDTAWLTQVLSCEGASIAHLHTFASQVLGTRAARRRGISVVRTEHSSRVYVTASCWPFSRWSLTHSDAVVAVSRYVARLAAAKAPWIAERLHTISNGVDTARWKAAQRPRPASPRPSLVLVARLEPRKRVDRALEAIARIGEVTLDVVGDGPERARLEGLTARMALQDRVRFHGFLADPLPIVQLADAALSTSEDEGLGLGLLECMATEVPVIAVPAGGIPEIVGDEATGWLAMDSSIDAIVLAVRRAMSNEDARRVAGARARRFVCDSFSLEAMAKAYGRLYASLAVRSSFPKVAG